MDDADTIKALLERQRATFTHLADAHEASAATLRQELARLEEVAVGHEEAATFSRLAAGEADRALIDREWQRLSRH